MESIFLKAVISNYFKQADKNLLNIKKMTLMFYFKMIYT